MIVGEEVQEAKVLYFSSLVLFALFVFLPCSCAVFCSDAWMDVLDCAVMLHHQAGLSQTDSMRDSANI